MEAQNEAAKNGTELAARPAPVPLGKFNHEDFWPRSWDEGQRYATFLARATSLLPKHILQAKDEAARVAEVFAHIMWGFEVGLSPMQSLRAIFIVHGRAGMYAADQVALVQRHPDCEYLEIPLDAQKRPMTTATSCTWRTKRRGRTEQVLTFTMAEAELEGLPAQNAKYKTAPAVMLRWRCATRLLAFTWGDVLRGLEDREHVEAEERDGGWAQRVEQETRPPPAPAARVVDSSHSNTPATEDVIDEKTGEVLQDAAPAQSLAERYLALFDKAATVEALNAVGMELGDAREKARKAGQPDPVSTEDHERLKKSHKANKQRLAGGTNVGNT
jgi:hypothetical protein